MRRRCVPVDWRALSLDQDPSALARYLNAPGSKPEDFHIYMVRGRRPAPMAGNRAHRASGGGGSFA
jgi:hypothetical protein